MVGWCSVVSGGRLFCFLLSYNGALHIMRPVRSLKTVDAFLKRRPYPADAVDHVIRVVVITAVTTNWLLVRRTCVMSAWRKGLILSSRLAAMLVLLPGFACLRQVNRLIRSDRNVRGFPLRVRSVHCESPGQSA